MARIDLGPSGIRKIWMPRTRSRRRRRRIPPPSQRESKTAMYVATIIQRNRKKIAESQIACRWVSRRNFKFPENWTTMRASAFPPSATVSERKDRQQFFRQGVQFDRYKDSSFTVPKHVYFGNGTKFSLRIEETITEGGTSPVFVYSTDGGSRRALLKIGADEVKIARTIIKNDTAKICGDPVVKVVPMETFGGGIPPAVWMEAWDGDLKQWAGDGSDDDDDSENDNENDNENSDNEHDKLAERQLEISSIVATVARMAECLADNGFLYTDMKRANTLYRCIDGKVQLCFADLGSLVDVRSKSAAKKKFQVTYMAPERRLNDTFINPLIADVSWGIGILWLSLLDSRARRHDYLHDSERYPENRKRHMEIVQPVLDKMQNRKHAAILQGLLEWDQKKRWTLERAIDQWDDVSSAAAAPPLQ